MELISSIYQIGTKNFLMTANPGECVISLNSSVTAIKFVITDYEKKFVFT